MYANRTAAEVRFLCRAVPVAVVVWLLLNAASAEACHRRMRILPPPGCCVMPWAATVEAYPPPAQAETNKEEPRYEFAMNGKPWKDVFVWLNEKTGLPIVGQAIPTGKFTFVGPTKKQDTMAEILDVVNEALLAHDPKYLLLHRERDIVIVPVTR